MNKMRILFYFYLSFAVFGLTSSAKKMAQKDSEDTTVKSLIDQFNEAKEKAKEITGINSPEDIPEVSDWMKKCEQTVSRREFRVIKKSPTRLMNCIAEHIKIDKIEVEVKDSMDRGELDLVFKKYCGRREEMLECVDEVLDNIKPCLNDRQLKDLNITRDSLDAGIDFICHENGDRIALFMSENGIECVQNNTKTIKECIKLQIPEVQQAEKNPKSVKIDSLLISEENCKKLNAAHNCIVTATTTCDDPTPSNILDSLITQSLKVTPCHNENSNDEQTTRSSSSGFYKQFRALLPHFLTVVAAGLTAAQILL